MIYFIYGNQSPTIKSQVKKIAKESLQDEGMDDFNFVRLDGFNVLVQDAVDECNYIPLGSDKKVVSLENCYFLLSPKPKNKIDSEQDYDALSNYLENPNPDATLILSVASNEVDTKSKLFNLLKEKAKVMPIAEPTESEWLDYCKTLLEKAEVIVDKDALKEIATRTNNDVALLRNTITKLSLYKKHITYQDVALLVSKPLEENAYVIFNLLMDKRNAEAVGVFRELKVSNTQPVTLVTMLANNFFLLSQISYLLKSGMENDAIAKELGIKPGRVYIYAKYAYKVKEDAIQRTLDDLYNLDNEIKRGLVDPFNAFEIFLLKFKTN